MNETTTCASRVVRSRSRARVDVERRGKDVATRRVDVERACGGRDRRGGATRARDVPIRRLESRATRVGRWGTVWGVVIGGLVVGRTGGRSDRGHRVWWMVLKCGRRLNPLSLSFVGG